ncbi:ribose-5-phosphate isomerase B [Listeria monocytogenes]|nr:ribose-5-phosphate isomerase B [Listeria monocytogenes]
MNNNQNLLLCSRFQLNARGFFLSTEIRHGQLQLQFPCYPLLYHLDCSTGLPQTVRTVRHHFSLLESARW